jgi:hypothetical protein
MQVVVATLVVFGLVTVAMSVGILFGRAPLRGSCGGPSADCPCSDSEKRACERRARDAA